jgi:hypothetical protein
MGKRIHSYSSNGWSSIREPGGSIGDLASDGNHLFALVFPDGDPRRTSLIKRYDPQSNSWDNGIHAQNYSIQTIYGAGGRIFAGGQHNLDYQYFVILLLEPSFLSVIRYRSSLLTGAAANDRGDILLATAGSGVFRFRGGQVEADPIFNTAGATITGIIETGSGSTTAVSSNGDVYIIDTAGSVTSFSAGVNFTGAMGVWREFDNGRWVPSLLLLGIRGRGSSRSHGYRELVLNKNNGIPTSVIKPPGDENPTSVRNRARYSGSIGVHPVEAILQLPESVIGPYHNSMEWEPPIFASTSRAGLWSYRNGQWNTEE